MASAASHLATLVNHHQHFTASNGTFTRLQHTQPPFSRLSMCFAPTQIHQFFFSHLFFFFLRPPTLCPSDLPASPLWRHLAASPHVNTNMRLAALRKQFRSQSLIITRRGNFTFNIRVSSSNCLARTQTHQLHLNAFKKIPAHFFSYLQNTQLGKQAQRNN